MSSGCATTASARVQSSGRGSSGGGVSMASSMPRNGLAATGRGPVGWSHAREPRGHRRARRRRRGGAAGVLGGRAGRPARGPSAPGPGDLRAAASDGAVVDGRARRRRTLCGVRGRRGSSVPPTSARSPRDNLHLAEVEVRVLPDPRRRGIGRALHDEAVRRGRADGRTTFIGEAYQPTADRLSAGVRRRFASRSSRGPPRVDLPSRESRSADGYKVLTWTNRAPTIVAYARMRTQMNHDVPTGRSTRADGADPGASVRRRSGSASIRHLVGRRVAPTASSDGVTP